MYVRAWMPIIHILLLTAMQSLCYAVYSQEQTELRSLYLTFDLPTDSQSRLLLCLAPPVPPLACFNQLLLDHHLPRVGSATVLIYRMCVCVIACMHVCIAEMPTIPSNLENT